jgi:hypothetical protein
MGYERNDPRFGASSDRYGSGGYGEERGRYGGPRGQDYRRDDERARSYGDPRYGRDRSDQGRARWDTDERGFFDRAGDEVRSWFGDEDAERRRRLDERDAERDERRRYGNAGYRPSSAFGDAGYAAAAGGYGGGEFAPSYEPRERADPREHDHGYRSWRDRQMEAFDRDYDEYRREHQGRFDAEFGTWRQQRAGQRDLLGRVQEHHEVVGSDGAHIGKVDHVRGDRILLAKSDAAAGGHHHSIPSSWIQSVDDKITVSKTAEQAQAHWRDEERGGNGLIGQESNRDRTNLNRSFSGTY